MKLEDLKKHLGIFDGHAICLDGKRLTDKTPCLNKCIQSAIWSLEEEYYLEKETNPKVEIWSVENITVKSVSPSGEWVLDRMWENFEFEEFLSDVSKQQL